MRAIHCLAFALAVAQAAAAELKIATVDLQRVLADYYKAQQATRDLKEKEVSFLKEMEGLRLEGRELVNQVESLRRLSLDPVLSTAAREEKRKSFELKLADLRAFEIRYDQVRTQKEEELQSQLKRVNQNIVQEVMAATRSVGERHGFNLVLNASKANPTASDVLFAKDVSDVTEQVIASLNATRPPVKDPPKADLKP
jgi:outer membrane protein